MPTMALLQAQVLQFDRHSMQRIFETHPVGLNAGGAVIQ